MLGLGIWGAEGVGAAGRGEGTQERQGALPWQGCAGGEVETQRRMRSEGALTERGHSDGWGAGACLWEQGVVVRACHPGGVSVASHTMGSHH